MSLFGLAYFVDLFNDRNFKENIFCRAVTLFLLTFQDIDFGILEKDALSQDLINAVFLDEMDIFYGKSIEDLADLVDVLWISPNATNMIEQKYKVLEDDFEVLDLSLNLRNTEEIVKKSKSLSEQMHYRYENGLKMPPPNFPNGCAPNIMESLKEALNSARKSTSQGILIITDDLGSATSKVSLIEPNAKVFGKNHTDFEEWENPYEFLTRPGSVLLTDSQSISGFEWPTVIMLLIVDIGEAVLSSIEKHRCNITLRCTTNLYTVNEEKRSESKVGGKLFEKDTLHFLVGGILRQRSVQASDYFYECSTKVLVPFVYKIFSYMEENEKLKFSNRGFGIEFIFGSNADLKRHPKLIDPQVSEMHERAEHDFLNLMQKVEGTDHTTLENFFSVFEYLREKIGGAIYKMHALRRDRIETFNDHGIREMDSVNNFSDDDKIDVGQILNHLGYLYLKEQGIKFNDNDDDNNNHNAKGEDNDQASKIDEDDALKPYMKTITADKDNIKGFLSSLFNNSRPHRNVRDEESTQLHFPRMSNIIRWEFEKFIMFLSVYLNRWKNSDIGRMEEGALKIIADNALDECLSCVKFIKNESTLKDVKELLKSCFNKAFKSIDLDYGHLLWDRPVLDAIRDLFIILKDGFIPSQTPSISYSH